MPTTDTSGDQITANIGNNVKNVAVGKNFTQVIHQYGDAPVVDLDTARDKVAQLPVDAIPPVTPLPAGSSLPFAPNPFFTGRQDELKTLAAALKGGADRGATVAIGQPQLTGATGMGGIGKSQLAAEFAHRYGQYFLGGVAWISFADAGSVPGEIVNACLDLPGLPPQVADMAQPDQVRVICRAWQSELPRLLIFDNCEEEELLIEWRPTSGAARILVTSRRSAFDPMLNMTLLPLRTLPRPDSIALLRRFRPDLAVDDPDLNALAAELGDLPLTLHMAGSYLKRYANAVDPAAYLEQLRAINPLRHRSLDAAVGRSPTDHNLSVARTFALSVDRLDLDDEIDTLAFALLNRAACFVPSEPIPRYLLGASLSKTMETDDEVAHDLLVEDAFIRLLELGLIDDDEHGEPVLHSLLAQFIRSNQNYGDAWDDVESTVIAEAGRISNSGDPRSLLTWQVHLRHVVEQTSSRNDESTALACNRLAYHLQQVGNLVGARPYFEKAVDIHLEIHGERHLSTALSLSNLGMLLRDLGELVEASSYLEHSLAIYKDLLGARHPDIAFILNNLGALRQSMGNLTEAHSYLEQARIICLETLGERHPLTAHSFNNLGLLLQAMGDLTGARSYLEQALAIRSEVLGKGHHPDKAQSLNNLGLLLQDMFEFTDARSYLEQALAIYDELLGREHPSTALGLNNLGCLLQATGDLAGARIYLEQALDIRKRVLGEYHPATANSLSNLGSLHQAMGDFARARPYLEQALAIELEILGGSHLETASSLSNLGSLHQAMGDFARARPYLEQALDIQREVLGESHSDTALSLMGLGMLHQSMNDLVTAHPYFEKALGIFRDVLGNQHPITISTIVNLGNLLIDLDDLATAGYYLEQALKYQQESLGDQHPSNAQLLNNLGTLYFRMGNLSRAHPYYEQALLLTEKTVGAQHPNMASSLSNLGSLHHTLGDHATAYSFLEQALVILESTLGTKHPNTQTIRGNLDAVLAALGQE